MIPDRADNVSRWPIDRLVVILLRQFKRLLAERGLTLSDARINALGEAVATGQGVGQDGQQATAALVTIVQESRDLLAAWGLRFDQSLATDMTDLADRWETTADFLALANEKVNAEVRISAGSALLLLLGDARHRDLLLQTIAHDLAAYGSLDVDAMIAQRALRHVSGIDTDHDDWWEALQAWAAAHPPCND